MVRLGAHMSIAGGMPRAVERGVAVGATALQVFVKSASQWAARPLDRSECRAFRRALRGAGLEGHTLAHASYLVNLASPDAMLWERSVQALIVEALRCRELGIPYLVVHPGSGRGAGEDEAVARVAHAASRVLGRVRGDWMLLLETTAGQGETLGATFRQLGSIVERARHSERLGVCFDTCHVLAAGYEFRDRESFEETIAELDRSVGISRLRAVHLNDSKGGLGCRKDRHEHIGRGQVGLEAFRLILNDARLSGLPMVLETPKGEDLAEDRQNLAVLRSLVRR